MKESIKSLDNVPQAKAYSWEFTTETGSLLAPNLLSPSDQSALVVTATPTSPTFSWEAVSGAHHYQIQVSKNDRQFSVIFWPTGTFDPTDTTVSPSLAFDVDELYYWRVRAVEEAHPTDEGDYGNWSDTWSFYVGVERVIAPQTEMAIDPDTRRFYITGVSPEVGSSDTGASSWVITFNQAINPDYVNSTYFKVNKYNVNGDPRKVGTVNGTFSVITNTVTFTPANSEWESLTNSNFAYNTEYAMAISKVVRDINGNKLVEDQTAWFSSIYNPLYLHWSPIRVDLGELVDEFSNDLIHRFVHFASLEVNRMRIPLPLVLTSRYNAPDLTTLSQVQAESLQGTQYFDVMTYVRARTEWMILQRKRFELLIDIDTKRVLGNVSIEEPSVALLQQVKVMQDELKSTADTTGYLIGVWSTAAGKATWASRSARYLPYPFFWSNLDYANVLQYRNTGASIIPMMRYGTAPSINYIARNGLY
jgi:hypothetical protein